MRLMRLLPLSLLATCAFAQSSFSLSELYGVSWPDQPIEFRYDASQASVSGMKMMLSVNGGTATEVPYEWIPASDCSDEDAPTGCIVVRNNLAANASNVWTLTSGTPTATPTNPVSIATIGNNIEVTNGLTGFRIITQAANAGPYTTQVYAPIQGIKLNSGTWTGSETNPNLLYAERQDSGFAGGAGGGPFTYKMVTATAYSVSVVDSGPMKTTIQASYTFNKPQYHLPGNFLNVVGVDSSSGSTPIIVHVDGKFSSSCGGVSHLDGSCVSNGGVVWMLQDDSIPVQISGILGTGVGPANASIAYIKHMNGDAGAFGLYQDSALTQPITGTLSYSSGGNVMEAMGPAGAGHYTVKVTLYAHSKSILVDEDTDMQFTYFLPIYNEVQMTNIRYRGAESDIDITNGSVPSYFSLHGTGRDNAYCGYETPLTITNATNASPIVITTLNSNFASLSSGQSVLIKNVNGNTAANGYYYLKPIDSTHFSLWKDSGTTTTPVAGTGAWSNSPNAVAEPGYRGGVGGFNAVDATMDLYFTNNQPCTNGGAHYVSTVANYPSADHGGGWYFEFYNSAGTSSSPVAGIFSGRFSKLFQVEATTSAGYTSNSHYASSGAMVGVNDGGFEEDLGLAASDGTFTNRIHRNWGIFVSTNSDLIATTSLQPINTEQQSLTGLNLSRLFKYVMTYPDPDGGWTYMYLTPSGAAGLKARIQDGTNYCGSSACWYNKLANSYGPGTTGRYLIDMFRNDNTTTVTNALNSASTYMAGMTWAMANGNNRFDTYGYYQFGLFSVPTATLLNAILMDSNTTTTQKATAKGMLAMLGSIMWDNDFWPVDNLFGYAMLNPSSTVSGDSVGLTNQIQQYLADRAIYATSLPTHPLMALRRTQAAASILGAFTSYFAVNGAAGGSTHYQSTFTEPSLLATRGLQNNGLADFSNPRWANNGLWELSSQTPPEPRFGNVRKVYSNGDGATEQDARAGMLANALQSVAPAVAGNLMWAYNQNNSSTGFTLDEQFTLSALTIDPTVRVITPNLTSMNFPGYHTAERHGYATNFETAVWFINGGFYSPGGHRHYDDGQISIYADNAPLAIDWNANLYSPDTPGRWMHNSIVMDSERSGNWNDDNIAVTDTSTLLGAPTNTEYEQFLSSTHSTATFTEADGTVWTRNVRTMAFDTQYPIIYVKDTFSGASASAPKTLTWNLMAKGAVTVPASAGAAGNSVTPTPRFNINNGCAQAIFNFPSNGTVYTIGSGFQPFNFTGYTWPAHWAQGINWDLYLVPQDTTTQFLIGDWGHGCHPNREAQEWQTNNASFYSLGGGSYCFAGNTSSFCEQQHILRVHDSGPFVTMIMPYPKSAAPSGRTVTTAACGTQVQWNSETTCFNDSTATYSDGTNNVLTSYDGTSVTAGGVTISGQSEAYVAPSRIEWHISGNASGSRSITVPSGYTTTAAGLSQSGQVFTYSWPGGLQTNPAVIVFVPVSSMKPAAITPSSFF